MASNNMNQHAERSSSALSGGRGRGTDAVRPERLQYLEEYARQLQATLSVLTGRAGAAAANVGPTSSSALTMTSVMYSEYSRSGHLGGTGHRSTPPPPPPPPPRNVSALSPMIPGRPRRPLPSMPPPPAMHHASSASAMRTQQAAMLKTSSLSTLLQFSLPMHMQVPRTSSNSMVGCSGGSSGAVAPDSMPGGQEAIYENLADLDLSFLEQSYLDRPRSAQSRDFDDELISSTSSLNQRSQTPSRTHNVIPLDQSLEALKLEHVERSSILDRLSEIERGLERIETQFSSRSLSMHRLPSSTSPLPGAAGVGTAVAVASTLGPSTSRQQMHHVSSRSRVQNGGHGKRRPVGVRPSGGGYKRGGYLPEYDRAYEDEGDFDGDDDDDDEVDGAGGKDNDDEDSPPPPYSAQAPPSHAQPPPGYVGQPPRIASSPAHQRWGDRLHHPPRQGSPIATAAAGVGSSRPTVSGGPGVSGNWGSHERVTGLWPSAAGGIPHQGSSSSLSSQQLSKGSDLDCQSIVSFQSSGDVGAPAVVSVMSPPPPLPQHGGSSFAQLLSNHATNGSPRNGPASVENGPVSGATGGSSNAAAPMGSKADMVYHLLTLLGHQEPQQMSQTLLTMSQSPQNCSTMRHSGCVALLIQLIHGDQAVSTPPNWTARTHASQALRNIVNAEQKVGNEQKGRRETRVLHMLEMIRDYSEKLLKLLASSTSVGTSSQDSNGETQPSPAMATLMKLSFDEEHRHTMTGLGGLQAIAELLEIDYRAHGLPSGSMAMPSMSSSSLNPAQSFSSGSSSECQSQHQQHQQICITLRRYAGMALTNLTFGDSGNKSTLCSYRGFMLALVAQLQSCSEDLRQVTASVLRNLSWKADQNSKQILREVGSVSKLMTAAIEANRESTLKSILSALWNLSAHCSSNKAEICATLGALEFLVDTLTYDAPSKTLAVVENAGGILRNISSHIAVRDDYRRTLRERRCLEILLSHLRSPSLTVVSNACGTLWNLSARNPEDQNALWRLGAVQMLKSLVHSKHRMIAMGSSAALKNLMAARPPGMDSSMEGSLGVGSPMSDGGFGPALQTSASVPRLQARKQKATVDALANQNLSETCDNIDANMMSPMSPGPPSASSSHATVDKMAFSYSADSKTHVYQQQAWSSQQQQRPHPLQPPMAAGMQRFFVPRSESRDSVHSTRSDSFCDRWSRDPTAQDGGVGPRGAASSGGTPQPIDLSCRARSQDPLSHYSGQDAGSLLNNNTTQGSPMSNNNNNMSETEFAARVSEISQTFVQKVDVDQCYAGATMGAVVRGHKVDVHGDKHKDSDSVRSRQSQESSSSSFKRNNGEQGEEKSTGAYAETDLDNPELPVDYSLIYAEEDEEARVGGSSRGSGSSSGKGNEAKGKVGPQQQPKGSKPGPPAASGQQYYEDSPYSFHDDAVRTYCTEGTPYSQTPYVISNAASLSDLTALGEEREGPGTSNTHGMLRGRMDNKVNGPGIVRGKMDEGKMSARSGSPEKPKTYCVEGTPMALSHASSLSSLTGGASECQTSTGPSDGVVVREKVSNTSVPTGSGAPVRNSHTGVLRRPDQVGVGLTVVGQNNNRASLGVDPRRQRDSVQLLSETSDLGTSESAATLTAGDSVDDCMLDDGAVTPNMSKGVKTVTFSAKEEETPLMFSRASSFDSLSSTDQHSIRSSVVSEFSRRTSGVVSPSELPDSPGGTMPPSPNRLKPAPGAFQGSSPTNVAAAGNGPAAQGAADSGSSSERKANDDEGEEKDADDGKTAESSENGSASGGKDVRRKLDTNLRPEDAFADETRAYAVEGTPFHQSHATSLSSLLNFEDEVDLAANDDDDDMGSEDRRMLEACMSSGIPKPKSKPVPVPAAAAGAKPVGVVEPTSKSPQKQRPQQLRNELTSPSPGSVGSVGSDAREKAKSFVQLPAQHHPHSQQRHSMVEKQSLPATVAKVEPQRRLLRDEQSTGTPPEYVTVYETEGTPANISHAGSYGNLSTLSFPSEAGFNLQQKSGRNSSCSTKQPAGHISPADSRIPQPNHSQQSSHSPVPASATSPRQLPSGSSVSSTAPSQAKSSSVSTPSTVHKTELKKSPSPQQQQQQQRHSTASVEDDEDDDDVLLQCIQSAMPKKKTAGAAGTGLSSSSGHLASSKSGSKGGKESRHSTSASRATRSPTKSSKPSGMEPQPKPRQRAPPTLLIPPPPFRSSAKPEASKRTRQSSGSQTTPNNAPSNHTPVEEEQPLYENVQEAMAAAERRPSRPSAHGAAPVPPARSRSVTGLSSAHKNDTTMGSSDDEDAESDLLQKCIQFGMPKSRSDLTDTKPFTRHHRSDHSSSSRRAKKASSSHSSDRRKGSDSSGATITTMTAGATSSTNGDAMPNSQAMDMTHSQIIRREAKSVATAIFANRDSMVDSYASTTSTASESFNLMESADPPPGLMEESVFASLTDSSSNNVKQNPAFLSGSAARNSLRKLGVGTTASNASTGSNNGAMANSKYRKMMEASMTSSSAYLENAKPPFNIDDMDHSMISIASITSEMATSSAAMKSSVTSENMFDLYRTAAAAMTAVYAGAAPSGDSASSPKTPPGAGNVDSEESRSEMLADVNPPSDLCDSLFGLSLSEHHSTTTSGATLTPGGGNDVFLNSSGAGSPTKSDGSKRSPKERRQLDKERYQTYTLATHAAENAPAAQPEQKQQQQVQQNQHVPSHAELDFDPEDPKRRSARKSRSGEKERHRIQTVDAKIPHRPRSSPEGSSETDTRAADKKPSSAIGTPHQHSLQHQQPCRAIDMDTTPDPISHKFEDDLPETDDVSEERQRNPSGGTKARVVKPGEGSAVEKHVDTDEQAKSVRGRRRPLHAPKTGTFTRPKPSPELAAMRSRIPDVSDSDSTVSVDSSTFTRSRAKSGATKIGVASPKIGTSPEVGKRSPLIVRETKTTKLRKQTSSPNPSTGENLLRSSSNVSVASSSADSHGKRTPKTERRPLSTHVSPSGSSTASSISPKTASMASGNVQPSKIAMLWRRADETRENKERAAAAAASAPTKPAVAPKKPILTHQTSAPPPLPVKPKIKLTQKIGRLIKGSSSKSSSSSGATPAAKEFIYRRPLTKASSSVPVENESDAKKKDEEEEEDGVVRKV